MTTPKDLPTKLEFLRFTKAPILFMCIIWSIGIVAFLLAIGALDAERATKTYDAVFLLSIAINIVAIGFITTWYQIRRLNKKLSVVADLLEEMNSNSSDETTSAKEKKE